MALTVKGIQSLETKEKRYRKADGQNLYIEVKPSGTKTFLFRVQMKDLGIDSYMSLGRFPALSLAEARIKRDQLTLLVHDGINPIEQKRKAKEEQQALEQEQASRLTFSQLFEQWHDHNQISWDYKYAMDIRNRITQHLLPTLGDQYIDEIKPMQIIHALKLMEDKGLLESLKKVKQYASRMFRYGVGMGLCIVDPVRDIPTADIFKKQTKQNLHHLTKPTELYQLLNAIDGYIGDISTSTALKLAPHVFLRPSELAGLRWQEVDLKNSQITIEPNRMKMKRPHLVPLSKQSKALIESMECFKETSDYVFPSPRSPKRPINEQSINAGLKRLGFGGKQTAHGFRHTASTLLNELGYNRDHIEKQLAHETGNTVRGTYNKAEYVTQRSAMMQAWSDYLDGIKTGADDVAISQSKGV